MTKLFRKALQTLLFALLLIHVLGEEEPRHDKDEVSMPEKASETNVAEPSSLKGATVKLQLKLDGSVDVEKYQESINQQLQQLLEQAGGGATQTFDKEDVVNKVLELVRSIGAADEGAGRDNPITVEGLTAALDGAEEISVGGQLSLTVDYAVNSRESIAVQDIMDEIFMAENATELLLELERLAREGNLFAKMEMGVLGLLGARSLPHISDADYLDMLLDAAENGMVGASRTLGIMTVANMLAPNYLTSDLDTTAREYITTAAEAGDLPATLMLGYWTFYGLHGVKGDCQAAWGHYEKIALAVLESLYGQGPQSDSSEVYVEHEGQYGSAWIESPITGHEVQYYEELAERANDPDAAAILGEIYYFGLEDAGVRQDLGRAVRYFRRAANQGHPAAQANLGLLHAKGQGVEADPHEAVRLFNASADSGNALAKNGLAYMYLDGLGVPKNQTKAVELFKEAAELGQPDALYTLGVLHMTGRGLPMDLDLAYHYFEASARSGSTQGAVNAATLEMQGLGTCESAVERLIEVVRRSPVLTELPYPKSLALELYRVGDYTAALRIYAAQGALGDAVSQQNAAYMLRLRKGIMDYRVAWEETSVLVEDGQKDEQECLWCDSQAFLFYEEAARQGQAQASRHLAECYSAGWSEICEQNFTKSAFYYDAAAESGDAHAITDALFLHLGLSKLPSNLTRAKELTMMCTELNYPENVPCLFLFPLVDGALGIAWLLRKLQGIKDINFLQSCGNPEWIMDAVIALSTLLSAILIAKYFLRARARSGGSQSAPIRPTAVNAASRSTLTT